MPLVEPIAPVHGTWSQHTVVWYWHGAPHCWHVALPVSDEVALPPGFAVAVSVAPRAPCPVGVKATDTVHKSPPPPRDFPAQPSDMMVNWSPFTDIEIGPVACQPRFVTMKSLVVDWYPPMVSLNMLAAGAMLSWAGWRSKVAVTDCELVVDTLQVPAPLQPPPDQEMKSLVLLGEATSVTLDTEKAAEQVPLHA